MNLLKGRSGWELMVIGRLADVTLTEDPISSAAIALDNVKARHPDLWSAMYETALSPNAVFDTLMWLRYGVTAKVQ